MSVQYVQEPEFELLRCVPQRVVHSPSWASLLIRVDCQLKPFTGPSWPRDPIQQPWVLSYTLRQPSRASCAVWVGGQNNAPSREGPVPGQVLSQNATRPSDRDQASLSSCLLTQPVPWFILCLFLETGWVLTLPPYHPTSVRQDSYLLFFFFSAPEVLGCSPANLQLFREPVFELLRCVPQRIVLSPSWASLFN